jgi:hypothetical protein
VSISVTVTGETTISLTVSPETAVSVLASGGIGPAGFLTAPGTSTNAFGTFQVQAGPGVTISTTSGVFQIASYSTTEAAGFAPVQSVAGRTGAVVLQAADITAGTLDIARIPTISYTALSNVPATFAPEAHTHGTADIVGLTAAASAAAPVQSVNGLTGAVTIARADLTAAAEVHTHSTADIVSFTAAASAAAPVQSVAGRTGTISLAAADVSGLAAVATSGSYTSLSETPVSFPPGTHNHTTTEIESFTAAAAAAAPVQGIVAGSNVTVTTSTSGIYTIAAAAGGGIGAAVESLNGQTGAITIQSGSNVTVSTAAGTITIAAPAPGDALPSQGGNGDRVLGTDGTSASWLTRYSVVEPVLLAGTGLAFTKDSAAGSITIEAAGGIVGSTAASVSTKSLSTDQNDYDAGSSDIVRLTPSANVTLTGLAGGSDGVLRVLYNVGTHVVTLSSGNTNSVETNRFSIVSGNVTLDEGDSASAWYDGTSQRWRVLEDQVASGGGSGGGIAMSYLFG